MQIVPADVGSRFLFKGSKFNVLNSKLWQLLNNLKIWTLSRILCDDIHKVAEKTELRKDYRLYNQIDGSSGSVMDNIAEGFERNGHKEFIQFLSISKASCGKTRSQLYRVFDRNYITMDEFVKLKEQTLVLSRMIGGFMNYLKKSDLKGSKYIAE